MSAECAWWKKKFYTNATLRNKVSQIWTAMLIGKKRIFLLCLTTLCHGKQPIWIYLIFQIFYRVYLKHFFRFAAFLKKKYAFVIVINPTEVIFCNLYFEHFLLIWRLEFIEKTILKILRNNYLSNYSSEVK